jgi:hypothetical protein
MALPSCRRGSLVSAGMLYLLLVCALTLILSTVSAQLPPPCITQEDELVYIQGALSAGYTMMRCLANMADPK